MAYSGGRKFSDRLLPTDISVRPEDFLKCLKWNKTYPVISSISWLNPLTQETNVSKDVRRKRCTRENSFNLKACLYPRYQNFLDRFPPINLCDESSTKHSTSTLLRSSDVIGLYEKNIRLRLCLGLFDIECFQSRGQHLCKFIKTKESVCTEKGTQFPQDWYGTPTWPPFHCFGTPIWLP